LSVVYGNWYEKGRAVIDRWLDSEDSSVRKKAVGVIAWTKGKVEESLLSKDLDGNSPWLDPQEAITEDRIKAAADAMNMSVDEVRSTYQALAAELHLRFETAESGDETGH
jgi:hypothetical protein